MIKFANEEVPVTIFPDKTSQVWKLSENQMSRLQPKNIYKDPKTDSGMKKSAKGLLRVDKINNEYVLKDECSPEEEQGGELKTVFEDGKLLIEHTFSEIKERLNSHL